MWSGPSSSMTYSGHAEAEGGRQLLEGGLPVEAGAHRGGLLHERVEQPVHHLGGGLDAAGEVDRPDDRLDGVGQDRGLVATAGGLLAAAQLDVLAEVEVAGHAREGAGVDDRGAQLGQPSLGEVRVGRVERLGHDDAQHRVAQELQALVGGEAAVLVRVGPVRQGAVEQPGIQDRITERSAQVLGGQ